MKQQLQLSIESWAFSRPFAVAGGREFSEAQIVFVQISRDGAAGRGEAAPFFRYGETAQTVAGRIESVRREIEDGADRESLKTLLPPGPARNALDCALWDLAAKSCGRRVWELAMLSQPGTQITSCSLGLDTPKAMSTSAERNSDFPVLKLKLGGEGDEERVAAVRRTAPRCRLMVDANEGWTPEQYQHLVPRLQRLGVEMIEQPFHADHDEALAHLPRPIPVCADESCHTSADLERIAGRYDFINIKLDKTGGLTEALNLAARAKAMGFRLMVGCMAGTSLGMAPAHLVAQLAEYADIDGPLVLAKDRDPPMLYRSGTVYPPEPALWG